MGWLHRSENLAITDSGVMLEVRGNKLVIYHLPGKEEPIELGSHSRELDAKKARAFRGRRIARSVSAGGGALS